MQIIIFKFFKKKNLLLLLVMKICSFITVRFHFGFRKLFIVDVFTIKFFFNTIADYIPNISMVFNNSSSSIKKFTDLVSASYYFYYVKITILLCARFWKNCSDWFSFIIIYVTNEVFIIFCVKRNFSRYRYVINMYIF